MKADNVGGIAALWVGLIQNLGGSKYNKATGYSSPAFAPGLPVTKVLFIDDTGSISVQHSKSGNGSVYNIDISCTVRLSSPEILSMVAAYSNRNVFAIILDNNGQYRLAGTREAPLVFSTKDGSGKQFRDLNSVGISITGNGTIPAPFILNPF